MTKFVEFYGLPGSGKTTIVKELQKEFKNKEIEGVIFYTGQPKFSLYNVAKKVVSILYLIVSGDVFKNATIDMIKIHSRIGMRLLFNFLWLKSLYLRFEKKDAIVVMDQGMVQSFWSLLYDSEEQLPVRNYNQSFEVYLVHLSLPYEIWSNRLLSRETNRSRVDNIQINRALYELWKEKMGVAQECWLGRQIQIDDIRHL